jgi:membrane-bound acyltransferase YfiQ involved in biofilm formation
MAAEKKKLHELDSIRGFACIAVLVMHSINRNNYEALLPAIEKLALFASPLFTFLASFLLFYSYRSTIPQHFLRTRLIYIMIPYVIWSFIYTAYKEIRYNETFPSLHDLLYNALSGQYHIYFILIIGQFYLLFLLIMNQKLVNMLIRGKVVLTAFLFNAAYLWYFAASTAPFEPIQWIWDRYYYLLFPAWIFYFLLGGMIARDYEKFKERIVRYKSTFIAFLVLGCMAVLTMEGPVTSKQLEALIYTASMIPVIFFLANRYGGKIQFLSYISKYSFGIYLAHPLFFRWTHEYFSVSSAWLYFFQSLTVQFLGAFLLTWIVCRLPLGSFIVGKVPGIRSIPRTSIAADKIKITGFNH